MPKISRAGGATNAGAAVIDDDPLVLLRGDRIRITDGALEFFKNPGDLTPDLRLYRSSDGTLAGGLPSIATNHVLGNVSGATGTPTALVASDLTGILRGAYPWVFDVTAAAYGAKGDGVTDDTAAINSAVTAAFTYAQGAATAYAEVYFPPGVYILGGALTQGGATAGNAQIPIPIQAGTARKVTLKLRGAGVDCAAMPHWNQTVGQRWATTLKSTLTGQVNDTNWGPGSVIGGPAVTGASATYGVNHSSTFNNVYLIVEGIGISHPVQPTVAGVDARGLCQVRVENCAVIADADTNTIKTTVPANDWTFGFMGPDTTNNDLNVVRNVSVYGQYTGFRFSEHTWADRVAAIYCHDGISFPAVLAGTHGTALGSVSVEGCVDAVRCYDSSTAPIDIRSLSIEVISGKTVNDPNNALHGEIRVTHISGASSIAVTGASNLRIVAQNQARGALTPPAVPTSTQAFTNPFWADCRVRVSGGTVTAIALDGTATGDTSGWFVVPTGGTITLTYSVAPSWLWWTL